MFFGLMGDGCLDDENGYDETKQNKSKGATHENNDN